MIFLSDLTERGRRREEAWPGFHNRAICCPRVCVEGDFAFVATSGPQIIQAQTVPTKIKIKALHVTCPLTCRGVSKRRRMFLVRLSLFLKTFSPK